MESLNTSPALEVNAFGLSAAALVSVSALALRGGWDPGTRFRFIAIIPHVMERLHFP